MANYLDTLNDRQREAVEQITGPVLIMAGAGSGKTKALTCRMAHMLEEGVRPGEILAITFTNKAAAEMKERVHNLVGPEAERIWIYTFHSFGARFLRREIEGYPPYTNRFTIYDADDAKQVVKGILKNFNMDDKQFQPQAVQSRISSAKNALKVPKAFREEASDFYSQKIADVYDEYDRILKKNNALDFDDLLLVTTSLLARADVRERWQKRFHYILIDEYQDTNHAQYLMARYIAGKGQNICAVGDADQSIYSWRGADMRNIMDFKKDYPNAKIIKLEQNYRSTKTILEAANAVIEHNADRPSKKLWTTNDKGTHIQHYCADDEHDEADFIVSTMKKEHENRVPYGSMAILYRMNAQSRVLEESLVRQGIAYTMVGGTRFYDRAEIKDMLAYMKVLENVRDDVSLKRIINVPKRGIGAATVEKISRYAAEKGLSFFEALMSSADAGVSGATLTKIRLFTVLLFDLLNAVTESDVFTLLQKIMDDTKYVASLRAASDPQAESREENLGELLSVAKDFHREQPKGSLTDFLEKVALVNDVDTYEGEADKVTLMTVHSAKGLEFPVVFLAGLDEGIFPGVRSLMDETRLEEERRLCYVGITRAKKSLYITNTRMRSMYGQMKPYGPSRFLAEIPKDLMDDVEVHDRNRDMRRAMRRRDDRAGAEALSVMTPPRRPQGSAKARFDWKVGDTVRHRLWGQGKVVEVRGSGKNMILKLSFPGQEVRQVMVAFAPITKEE